MSTTEQPIMVRAEITQDEWRALRRLALDQKITVQHLVGAALRRELEGTAVQPAKDDAAAPSGG